MKHHALLFLLCALSFPSPAAPAGPKDPKAPADLRLRWTAGQRQQQRISMVMNTETAMNTKAGAGPTQASIQQDVTLNMEYDLAAVGLREGGGQELELTLGDLDMAVQTGGRDLVRFDTRVLAAGPETGTAALMRSLVGTRMKCLLNASNSVERVEGWRDPVRKATAAAPAAGRGALAGVLTEGYFKQLADFARLLPQRSVRPGESWTNQQDVSLGPLGRVLLDMTYTFQGWETRDGQSCAAVQVAGTARSAPAAEGTPSPFGRMSVEGGRIGGTYWFNPEAGRMVETSLQQDLTMGIEVTGLPPTANANAGGDGKPARITSRFRQKTGIKFSVPPAR